MTQCIIIQDRKNGIKRVKNILNQFEETLQTAENLYTDAVKDGNIIIQKEAQKKVDNIKKEIAYLNKIVFGLENL
jgi:hypothetical protein